MDGEIEVTEQCLLQLNKRNRNKVFEIIEEMWNRMESSLWENVAEDHDEYYNNRYKQEFKNE